MDEQLSLFSFNIPKTPQPEIKKGITKKEELSALDEMFAASQHYRNSREYLEMLRFVGRFPKYSPYNCFLLYTQNPSISYVATAGAWERKFGRYPKLDSRPLVILAPMSPVLFVYDLKDTEGKPVPTELLRPFETQGGLQKSIYDRTKHNSELHRIAVREVSLGHMHAGSAIRLNISSRKKYRNLNLGLLVKYLVLINKEYSLEDKYSSLAHELGHIFCGHLGNDDETWWEDRSKANQNKGEIEAESVAFLVCLRKNLQASSKKYLSGYDTTNMDLPIITFNDIINATTYIESMGKQKWEKPKKIKKKKIVHNII